MKVKHTLAWRVVLIAVILISSIAVTGIATANGGVATDTGDKQPVNNQQNVIEEKHFTVDSINDECNMKDKTVSVDKGVVITSFNVEIAEDGEYYAYTWAMCSKGQQIQVYSDSRFAGQLEADEDGWQFARVSSMIPLSTGMHTIAFESDSENVPMLDFIYLSQQAVKEKTSWETDYEQYISELNTNSLAKDYEQQKVRGQTETGEDNAKSYDPLVDYAYSILVPVNYTYWGYYTLTAGQAVVFETRKNPSTGSNPVMYLFNYSDPVNNGSWSDDNSGGGYQSRISCTPTVSGTYILLLTSKYSYSPGTSDLYKNGVLVVSNAALTVQRPSCVTPSKTGELNYFTCKLANGINPDTRLWLEDSSSTPGKIKAYNDDYSTSGDFNWGRASRVKKSFTQSISYAIVSSYSTATTGSCDVYMKCSNGITSPSFPNLKADDSIQAAVYSENYNCIGWSGGMTIYVWPLDPTSPWYNATPLTAFDHYYGNTPLRYIGATTYTRTGATASNSMVDLWALSGSYTHGSVRKPGNNHPHGYDWESKAGWASTRFFHPRYALNGPVYGAVDKYYIPATLGALSFEESIQAGLSVEEIVEFTEAEKTKIANLAEKLPQEVRKQFEAKYEAWKATWDDPSLAYQSDPRAWTKSAEYKDLLNYCQTQGERVWPLVLDRLPQEPYFIVLTLLEDLTLDKFSYILDKVREESQRERYDKDGKYIIPSAEANGMKYAKELLALL